MRLDRVKAVRSGLGLRYRATVDVGAGCGLRQGEIFGLDVEDIDVDGGWLHVRRQVKKVRSRLVFGLPKNDKERRIPLPGEVARALKLHMEEVPPVLVTLPWEQPAAAELVSVRLVSRTPATRPSAATRSTACTGLTLCGWPASSAEPTETTACTHFATSTPRRCLTLARASGPCRSTWATEIRRHAADVHPPDARQR
jgi:hypothetical protein